jgi:hypothetical protein
MTSPETLPPPPETIIRPHRGPQEKFLASNADIAIYGGSAGSGKTVAMLMEPLRHVHVANFNAVIFRRTSEQVRMAGGLWDESCKMYSLFGAKPREHTLEWRFASGANVRFEQLQYENTKLDYQGSQIALLAFDELTHFSDTQFFYMLSRNRSTCGVKPYVRATCNPDSRSWVARFISWWINPDSGLPIPERSGVKRFFVRVNEDLIWSDSRSELEAKYPGQIAKSVTFVPAKLADNNTLMEKDPSYLANLLAQPRVERERLLHGNWKTSENSIVDLSWLRYFDQRGDVLSVLIGGQLKTIDARQCSRFATIDTAGSSRDRLDESKGKPCSWSVVAVWDYWTAANLLFLRHIWRDRVGWNQLKDRVPSVLKTWGVHKVYIENAHVGPALRDELEGFNREMVGPMIHGMTDSGRGAKLERAIASGVLGRIEDGLYFLPSVATPWKADYINELTAWGGLPDETADQIDVSSYAAYVCKKQNSKWGGVVNVPISNGMRF